MTDLLITKADLDENNVYKHSRDIECDGAITFAPHLGNVIVNGSIRAAGSLAVSAGTAIEASRSIKAGESIEAGWSIKAGESIEAGWSIEAGGSIEAGWSIKAGFTVSAKWISARLRIFAGLCSWRLPTPEECEIRAEVRGGTVGHGTVVVPAEKVKP
jgi:hypothetical protein